MISSSPIAIRLTVAFAFLMEKEEWSREDLYDKEIPDDHLPVIAVPTTCGTGSEVTAVSVLTMHAKRTKGSIPHKIFPDVALIDGKYLASALPIFYRDFAYQLIMNTYENSTSDLLPLL